MRVARRHAGQSSRRTSSYNRQSSFALIGLVRNSIDHPRRSYGGWSPLRPARVLTPQRERDIREKAPVPNEASYKTIILWRTTTYGVVKWITKPNQSQLRDGFRFSYVNPEAQRSSWRASERPPSGSSAIGLHRSYVPTNSPWATMWPCIAERSFFLSTPAATFSTVSRAYSLKW